MKNRIITISREYGSGGHEIAQRVAQQLDLDFYDKELITLAAEESGIDAQLLETMEEQLAAAPLPDPENPSSPYTLEDRMFLAQSRVIQNLANREPCVIVGRAANHVLANRDDCLHFFVYAELDERIKRISGRLNVSPEEAEKKIQRTDKARAAYYKHYTGKEWGLAHNYTVSLDSGYLGIEGVVGAIRHRFQPEWKANKVGICG